MRLCVIGAGAAGLCAARHLSSEPFSVTVYEQSDCVGGTWVYTECTDTEPDTGLPIHSSMYKSLWTNLPKEVMGFPDFPIPEQERSYLPAKDILSFLNLYTDHFKLRPLIKFRHHVQRVEPEKSGWRVTVTDLSTKTEVTEQFDAIMVCNGHYHTPQWPQLPGQESFPGLQLHSHSYREPGPFIDRRVLILGAGPSGMDLALEISRVADKVILSHHLKDEILTKFPDNLIQKTDIQSISGSTVTFQDGSQHEVDVLFYCTGYKYSFPFLAPECGVAVQDNRVTPLYKHLVHIHKPTLCFVGLPFYVCAFTMFDIQVQYCKRMLLGEFSLPSVETMARLTAAEEEEMKAQGLGPRQYHMMGPRQGTYYDSLTEEAGLPRTPPVLTQLHNYSSERFLQDLVHYRQDNFRIIDDHTYIQVN